MLGQDGRERSGRHIQDGGASAAAQGILPARFVGSVADGEDRRIRSQWLDTDEGLDRYTKLVRTRDCETKALADKATKLRLTNQARYTPQAAGTAAKKSSTERKPWQMTG
jgi:hypothetical protein